MAALTSSSSSSLRDSISGKSKLKEKVVKSYNGMTSFLKESSSSSSSSSLSLPSKRVNVLMIGQTGAGKSSLGNFFFNLTCNREIALQFGLNEAPNEKDQLFRAGGLTGGDPVTRLSTFHEFETHGMRLCLIDTPGLGETDPVKDCINMIQLLRFLQKLRKVHCLVYVMKYGERNTSLLSETMNYYRVLLKNIFLAKQVIVVVGHLSTEFFESETHLDFFAPEALKREKENVKTLFRKEWEMEPDDVFFIGCLHSQKKLKRFLAKVKRKGEEGEGEDWLAQEPDDLLQASVQSRENLLNSFSGYHGVSLETTIFPLPPRLEEFRKNQLELIKEKIQVQKTTCQRIDMEIALELDRFEKAHTTQFLLGEKLNTIRNQIVELSGVQRSEPFVAKGQDFFHSPFSSIQAQLKCPIQEYRIMLSRHNASFTVEKEEIVGRGVVVHGLVYPDSLSFFSKDNARWFLRVYLEYSGEEYNKDLIDIMRVEMEGVVKEVDQMEGEIIKMGKVREQKMRQFEELKKDLEELQSEKLIFGREMFVFADVGVILKRFEDHAISSKRS